MKSKSEGMAFGRNQRKLTNFIIHPAYQFRYILLLNVVAVLMFSATGAVFYLAFSSHVKAYIEDAALVAAITDFWAIAPLLLGLLMFFIVIVSLLGIYFSHRTAGPMYRFRVSFRKIAEGDKDLRVRLRPADDFRDVAVAFNEMMDELEEKKE